MNIKLVLNSDIHKVGNKPSTYQELIDAITRTFKAKLPSYFDIKYKDNEDDMIIIQDEESFQIALEAFKAEKLVSLKIYIIPKQKPPETYETKSVKIEQSQALNDPKLSQKSVESTSINLEKKTSDTQNNIPTFSNNNFTFLEEANIITIDNRPCNSKNMENEKISNEPNKENKQFGDFIDTPFLDDSPFEKILSSENQFYLENSNTPDIETLLNEGPLRSVSKAFEILDKQEKSEKKPIKPLSKSENAKNIDINLQVPTVKEKEVASPLKPPIFLPLETLKEEESIVEEKSSEYPLKEVSDIKNIQILESASNELIPKKLCIKCCKCSGTGIEKGKGCSKCVKGLLKVNKKMINLINHVLSFKLSTKFRRLLELNEDIGKTGLSLFEQKDSTNNKLNENKGKTEDQLKKSDCETIVCQSCLAEIGQDEIKYKSIDGDFYLCEKCEVLSNCELDLIKINPQAQKQAAMTPSTSLIRQKHHINRRSETVSLTTNENWANSSLTLSTNKNHEIKAKLMVDPQPITATPDSKINQFIEVFNSGSLKWPNNVYLVNVSGEFHEEFIDVPSLEKGVSHDIHLELVSPSKPGKYYSAWRLSYLQENEENSRKFFGPRITFEVNIELTDVLKQQSLSNKKKVEQTAKHFNSTGEFNTKTGTSSDFKIYTDCNRSLLEKATLIQKAFPKHDVAYYVEFLKRSKDKDKSINEIVDANLKELQK